MEEIRPTQSIEKEAAVHPLMDIVNSFSEPNAEDEALIIQQFPVEFTKHISILAELQEKKEKAWEKAQEAQEAAEQMKSFVTKKFLGHEYKSGDKAEIITDTQNVVKLVADSEKDLADAMRTSFEFQDALAKSSEFLYGMGCINIAANEAMIDQIVSIRDNKSTLGKFQLTEEVKERILDVAKRLKTQQDILRRQASHEERVKRQFADWRADYDPKLSSLDNHVKQHDDEFESLKTTISTSSVHFEEVISALDTKTQNAISDSSKKLSASQDQKNATEFEKIRQEMKTNKEEASNSLATLEKKMQDSIEQSSNAMAESLSKESTALSAEHSKQFSNLSRQLEDSLHTFAEYRRKMKYILYALGTSSVVATAAAVFALVF